MILEASGLRLSVGGRLLVKDLSFSFYKGLVLVEGPSRSGKSLLLDAFMGIREPEGGELRRGFRSFSYMGQRGTALLDLTLGENVSSLLGVPPDSPEVALLADALGLSSLMGKRVLFFSIGERAKAELLLCLLRPADAYFLDEPFSSLDASSRERVASFLNSLAREHLVIVVNHQKDTGGLSWEARISFDGEGGVSLEEKEGNPCSTSLKVPQIESPSVRFGFLGHFRLFFRRNISSVLLFAVLPFLGMSSLFMGVALTPSGDGTRLALEKDPFSLFRAELDGLPLDPLPEAALWTFPISFYSPTGGEQELTLVLDLGKEGPASFFPEEAIPEGSSLVLMKEEEESLLAGLQETALVLEGARGAILSVAEGDFLSLLNKGTPEEWKLDIEGLYLPIMDGESLRFRGNVVSVGEAEPDFLSVGPSLEASLSYPGGGEFLIGEDGSSIVAEEGEPFVSLGLYLSLSARATTFGCGGFESWGNAVLTKEGALSLVQEADIRILDLIRDGIPYLSTFRTIFYLAGGFLLALSLLSLLLSRKTRRRFHKEVGNALFLAGRPASRTSGERLLIEGLLFFVPSLVALLLYGVALLPLASLWGMEEAYGGYGYAVGPAASHYFSVESPLPFATFAPWSLLLLLAPLFLALLSWGTIVLPSRKERR